MLLHPPRGRLGVDSDVGDDFEADPRQVYAGSKALGHQDDAQVLSHLDSLTEVKVGRIPAGTDGVILPVSNRLDGLCHFSWLVTHQTPDRFRNHLVGLFGEHQAPTSFCRDLDAMAL